MGAGRENFCQIRRGCIGKIGPSSGDVVVPQYDDHRGITISMTDDREEFYQTIGELLARSTTEPIFSPRIFRTILDLCDKSDKTGKQLQIFYTMYNRFYSQAPNVSRDVYKLLPFDQELNLLEESRRGIHATTINAKREKRFPSMRGGRKKRRRRKRKTKRKRRKKTKKSRRRRKKRTRRNKKGGFKEEIGNIVNLNWENIKDLSPEISKDKLIQKLKDLNPKELDKKLQEFDQELINNNKLPIFTNFLKIPQVS